MTWDLPISSFWIPSLSFWLHTFKIRSSVSTGWIIRPDLSIGTWILWNRRLVLREYCSWFSSRVSRRLICWYRSPISVLYSFSVCSFEVTLLFVAITSSACFFIIDFCSAIVSRYFCIVSLKGLICSSKADLTCASTVLLSECAIDSHNLSEITGIMWSRTSGLVKASTILSAIVFLRPKVFFDVVELKSPSELRRLMCLAIPGMSSGLSGLQLFLEGIGLEGVSVLISELFSIDVFGWELDKSKFVNEVISFLFTFMDAAILINIVHSLPTWKVKLINYNDYFDTNTLTHLWWTCYFLCKCINRLLYHSSNKYFPLFWSARLHVHLTLAHLRGICPYLTISMSKARYQNTYLQHRDLSVYTITTHSNITSWCRRIYHHYTLKHKYNVDLKCQPSSVTSLRR